MSYLEILQKLLPQESIDDIVRGMIKEYANQSIDNASMLIKQIVDVSDVIVKKNNERLVKAKESLYWMICHHETEKKNWNIGMLIPICIEVFPYGCVDGHCGAEKKFFEEFLEFLRDIKNFDFKNDKDWAEQHNYWNWLCMVREKNM